MNVQDHVNVYAGGDWKLETDFIVYVVINLTMKAEDRKTYILPCPSKSQSKLKDEPESIVNCRHALSKHQLNLIPSSISVPEKLPQVDHVRKKREYMCLLTH